MKKMASLDVIRLGDPAATAALDATQKAVRDRYASQIQAALAEMRTILAGREPRGLKGATAVAYMAAKTRFDALIMEQKRFAEAELTRRLAETSSTFRDAVTEPMEGFPMPLDAQKPPRPKSRGGREAAPPGADAGQPGFRHLTGRQP